MTNTKTIKPHRQYISKIILLQNGNLATSSLDHYIKIYNKNTFEEQISIKENKCVDWIESCPRDKAIRIYELNDKSYKNINVIKQDSCAWKMKELQNSQLASTMSNSDIKIG